MSRAYIATNVVNSAHEDDIYAVATSEHYTITGGGDGAIILWDNNEAEPKPVVLDTHKLGIHHLAVDATNNIIVAVGFESKLHFYSLQDLKPLNKGTSKQGHSDLLLEALRSCFHVLFNFNTELDSTSNYWAVALARDRPLMAASTVQGDVEIWDLDQFKKLKDLPPTRNNFGVSVDISLDGQYAATGHDNGGLYLYSVDTGRLIYSLSGNTSAIRAVKFSPANNLLAAAGDSSLISIYSVASGEHIYNLTGHTSWIFSLAWSSTGEYLLSVSHEGKARIWSIESRSCVATQGESNKPLLCGQWLDKGWGKGVIGGRNVGFVTVGIDNAIRWYREAAGS